MKGGDILVFGSQAILGTYDDLGTYDETEPPEAAIASIEADLAFLDDADNSKSDAVDGAIGELSSFHESKPRDSRATSAWSRQRLEK